jgi:DNA-binding GntR family transcriptional regulator
VEAAGNSKLNRFYQTIFPSLARYQSMYTFIPGLMNQSHGEHEAVLESIKRGEYEEARKLLSAHINKFVTYVSERIGSFGASGIMEKESLK